MAATSRFIFQWQNKNLRSTIYPFRDKKLRDFLLYYREIDLIKQMSGRAVEPRLSVEIIQALSRVESELKLARLKKEETEKAIKALQLKHRETLRSEVVRKLAVQKAMLHPKVISIEPTIKRLERQVEWYRQFAPSHPFFEKYTAELKTATENYQKAKADLDAVLRSYNAALAPYEIESKSLQAQLEELRKKIAMLTDELRRFPKLDKTGAVNQNAAAKWLMLKYERDISSLDHDGLVAAVLKRFDAEPQRFPKWLQYMVIHFSGMRYKSAHGSWADPKVLLEALITEEQKGWAQKATPVELTQACQKATAELQQKKLRSTNPNDSRLIDAQITALANPVARQAALLRHQASLVAEQIKTKTSQQVLTELKARKGQLPEWAWKEIVSRTELRLETQDETWETLNPVQQQERWKAENERWRSIMDFWERRDITDWRKQHELTLSLVVTRAVCNEIAEHIQHLRGVKPASGLTSKPIWYIRSQSTDPQNCYFRRPTGAADFKPGASILWLGWVDKKPNPWQIAHPLPGYDLAPVANRQKDVNKSFLPHGQEPVWSYATTGGEYTRTAIVPTPQPAAPGQKPKIVNQRVTQWLRWTHEATVISVERMADGRDYVLTFETGQIGVILRSYWSLVDNPEVFVGYVPPGKVEPANLDKMIARDAIILPAAPEEEEGASFSLGAEDEYVSEEQVDLARTARQQREAAVEKWLSLTPRQRQAAALICQGMTTREAATKLDTSVPTVRSHLSAALRKFGVLRREDLCKALAGLDTGMWQE